MPMHILGAAKRQEVRDDKLDEILTSLLESLTPKIAVIIQKFNLIALNTYSFQEHWWRKIGLSNRVETC
jgi:hypothetical protein